MPSKHVIRLRGAWTGEPSGAGITQWSRRFGWTATLSPSEHVHLVVDNASAQCRAWVNDVSLERRDREQSTARFEITHLLRPRNEVVLEASSDRPLDVRLEIESGD